MEVDFNSIEEFQCLHEKFFCQNAFHVLREVK